MKNTKKYCNELNIKQPSTITKQMSAQTLVVPASTNMQPLSPPKPFPIAVVTPATTMTTTIKVIAIEKT